MASLGQESAATLRNQRREVGVLYVIDVQSWFGMLEFLETSVFTRRILELLSDEEYAGLQGALVVNPETGDLIPGTGGLRKIRWQQSRRAKGKRGGVRVIYYWYGSESVIYMLLAYSKGEQDDLSASEKRSLKRLVAEEFA